MIISLESCTITYFLSPNLYYKFLIFDLLALTVLFIGIPYSSKQIRKILLEFVYVSHEKIKIPESEPLHFLLSAFS